jgi:hypothetical protein
MESEAPYTSICTSDDYSCELLHDNRVPLLDMTEYNADDVQKNSVVSAVAPNAYTGQVRKRI